MVNFDSANALEECMSRPTPELESDLARTSGDILVLGVGGKMGPTLARMAKRAAPVYIGIGIHAGGGKSDDARLAERLRRHERHRDVHRPSH